MNQAPKVAYIGLGSNLGDRAQNIQNAIEALQEKHVHVAATSQLYETNPVDVCEQQPKYINAVIRIQTSLTLQALFELTRSLEYIMGRRDKGEKKPRTIDMDLLLYDNETHADQTLQIPHPRMTDRQFVLVPLSEVLTTGWPEHLEDIQSLCQQFNETLKCFKANKTPT